MINGVQRESAGEVRKDSKGTLNLRREELARPAHSIAHGLLSSRGIAHSPRQELQTAIEHAQHAIDAEHPAARSSKFDGERYSVQAATQFLDLIRPI